MSFAKFTKLEETKKNYIELVNNTGIELLIAAPVSALNFYKHNDIQTAFYGATKRGVSINVLFNRQRPYSIPGNFFEAAVPLIDHYAISDRKCGFISYFRTCSWSEEIYEGTFYYSGKEENTVPDFVKEHIDEFKKTRVLSCYSG